MATETIEDMIVAMERRGWRLSNLSHIAGPQQYSCILERKKVGEDGFPVYASSEIRPTAREAVAEAWANAQRPINNPRIGVRRSGATKPLPPLADWLSRNVGHRLRLEDALDALQKCYSGEEEEDGYL